MKVCTDACLFGAWMTEKIDTDERTVSKILDIGTGTGLLSLMLAQKTTAIIDAIELDEEAAAQAANNFELSPWKERLQVIQGDVCKVNLGRKYDLIISNPPFFENDLKSADSKRNLALHGEALEWDALLAVISKHLSPDGKFGALLPYHRKKAFEKLAWEAGFFTEEEVSVKQTPVHPYFRAMLLFGKDNLPTRFASFIIREGDQYTNEFAGLLKDYYLKL